MLRRTTRRTPRTRGPARPPLRLQRLEDRTVPAQFAWRVDASGNWNNPNNWLLLSGTSALGYPDAVGDSALLGAAITANRTITIPDGVTISVGDLQFNDNNNYTIAAAGTGRLVFDNTNFTNATLLVASTIGSDSHTISAPITLIDTLEVTNQSTGVLTFSGAIADTDRIRFGEGLIASGTGVLRLSGGDDNSFAGTTTVQSGTLQLNKTAGFAAFGGNLVVGDGIGAAGSATVRHLQDNNIPAASSVTVNADGLYDLFGVSESVGPLVVNGGIVTVGVGLVSFTALTMTGGSITASAGGVVFFGGNATINASATGSTISGGAVQLGNLATRTFTVADGTAAIDLNISSAVQQGIFGASLTKAGPGTMRLGGPGTFAGTALLSAGTLLVGDNTALGTGQFAVNGGTVQADGAARTLANILALGGDFTVAGSLGLTFTGAVTLIGNRAVTVTNTGLTNLTGAVGQDAPGRSLTKAGAGTLRLSGTAGNTYSGTTTLSDGALELNKTPGAAAFSGNLVVGDGSGAAASAVVRHLQGNNILLAASVTVNGDGLYDLNGQSEDFGPLVVNGGTANAVTGILSLSTLTMTGGSVIATGNGEVQLNGNVTATSGAAGGATISGGRVQLGNVTRTFTVNDGPAAVDLDVSSEIRQLGGTAGLTKAGAGTLRLSGSTSNTYTGLTTVSAGTLELNKLGLGSIAVAVPADLTVNGGVVREVVSHQIADAAVVNVNPGGTFDLNSQSDTVGTLTVTGGTLTTNGGRLLATGNASFNAAATLAMNLVGATTSDRLTVNGTLAVGGALQLSLASTVAPGTAITLIDNAGAGAVAGTFTNLPQGAMVNAGGQSFTISYTGGTGNDVVLTRVNPPRVLDVQSNGGAAQRSMVTFLTVTFDRVVTLPANVASAFTLTRIGGGAVSFTATQQTVGGLTLVILSGFSGAETSFGSLNDGRYALTALASQITAGGVQLDGNGDGNGGDDFVFADSGAATGNQLYRFFGDITGDRFVNGADFAFFRTAFGSGPGDPNYNAAFDVNGDGFVNGADFAPFRLNFGGNV